MPVQEVNSELICLCLKPCKNYEGDSCTGILMKVGKNISGFSLRFSPITVFMLWLVTFSKTLVYLFGISTDLISTTKFADTVSLRSL